MTAVCTCGADLVGRRSHAGACALVRLALAPKPQARGFRGGCSRFATAQPTACGLAHRHPSKTEARVCDRLHAQLLPGERIVRQVRLPLLATPNPDAGTFPFPEDGAPGTGAIDVPVDAVVTNALVPTAPPKPPRRPLGLPEKASDAKGHPPAKPNPKGPKRPRKRS